MALPTRSSVLGLARLALGACTFGSTYVLPARVQSTAFSAAPPAAARDRVGAAPALDSWWTGFDDPELTTLVTRALAQNLDLAQAEALVTQARAQAKAAGAALLPADQLNAKAA